MSGAASINANFAASDLKPYKTDTTDGTVIYECWESGADPVVIRKTTIAGVVITVEVASAAWADRAAATYKPLYD